MALPYRSNECGLNLQLASCFRLANSLNSVDASDDRLVVDAHLHSVSWALDVIGF